MAVPEPKVHTRKVVQGVWETLAGFSTFRTCFSSS